MAALDQAFALLHSDDPASEAKLEKMLALARARRPRGRKVSATAGGKVSRMGAGLKPPSSSSSSTSIGGDVPPPAKRARTIPLSAPASAPAPGTANASQAQAKDGAKPPLALLGRRVASRGGGIGSSKSKPALVTLGRSKGKRK